MNIIEEINLIKEAIRFDKLAELLDIEKDNTKRIETLEVEQGRCPIKMDAIQLYAEEFQHANTSWNEIMGEIRKITQELAKLKQKINEVIDYVKNTN